MLRRINRKQSFERKTIVKESEEMIETVEELNAFLSDLINDEVDVTAENGAGGLHDPNYGYMSMTMKAKEKDGETEVSCLVPDIEAVDWSGYVDDVLKNIKKWNWHTDDEEGILNAMLECLTDYFLFHVGEDTKEVETFNLPISKDEIEDIIFEDTNELEKELENFVVDKFYDEIEKRANKKEESKQIRRCKITRKIEARKADKKSCKLENARFNDLDLVEGTYVLMQDVDRFNDIDYKTRREAVGAMKEAQDDGEKEMWVGYVENTGSKEEPHLDIIFEEGESA